MGRIFVAWWFLIVFFIGLHYPITVNAQCDNCGEILNIVTFNYPENINIGKFRNCSFDCKWYDLDCLAKKFDCERIKASQILAGEIYEEAIHESHDLAAKTAVPIPQNIRNKIGHLFPKVILDNARYTTDTSTNGVVFTIFSLQEWAIEFNNRGGITLGEIIILNDNLDLSGNTLKSLHLWVHELEHVVQYEQLGIDGFAQTYTFEAGLLENWAERKADLIVCNRTFIKNCISPIPLQLVIENKVLDGVANFEARDRIIVGPNVTLGANGDVLLRAGNIITFNPEFKSVPGGKLRAEIDESLKQ